MAVLVYRSNALAALPRIRIWDTQQRSHTHQCPDRQEIALHDMTCKPQKGELVLL